MSIFSNPLPVNLVPTITPEPFQAYFCAQIFAVLGGDVQDLVLQFVRYSSGQPGLEFDKNHAVAWKQSALVPQTISGTELQRGFVGRLKHGISSTPVEREVQYVLADLGCMGQAQIYACIAPFASIAKKFVDDAASQFMADQSSVTISELKAIESIRTVKPAQGIWSESRKSLTILVSANCAVEISGRNFSINIPVLGQHPQNLVGAEPEQLAERARAAFDKSAHYFKIIPRPAPAG